MAQGETVALVLAGGGARGAYEIGVLSVLLPRLDELGQRPALVIGTSVGALNTAFLAAHADRPVAEVVARGREIWSGIRYGQVLSGLGSLRALRRLGSYAADLLAGRPVLPYGLLDPAPLGRTLETLVAFDRLQANVAAGRVRAAVATTSAYTSESVVFHAGGDSPERDDRRGIDYVATELTGDHVRASAAIPAIFPAVRITGPPAAAGWYFDGGTRLNTPIKPALTLGADRVAVIGLNSLARPGDRLASDERPDVLHGASQLVQAVLVDPLINDIQTLVGENRIVAEAERRGGTVADRRRIPYLFVAPQAPDAIGRIASEVYARHYTGPRALVRSPELALLGRLLGGAEDPVHGELLSYLFFAPEFTRELIALGREDGERWLGLAHDDELWRLGSRPPAPDAT
jgi:NTE family protein